MAGTVRPWASERETYTHGHAESVLRSHRWRTVENSAAYLLPHLAAGRRPARRRAAGRARSRSTWPSGWRPGGWSASTPRPTPSTRRAAAADEAGVDNLELAAGDVYALDHADDSFDVVHAHQVLQHLGRSRGGAARDAAGVPARRRGRRAGLHLPGHELVPGVAGARPVARRCTARSRRPTAASPTPGATCGTGASRPASRRWRRRPPPGASPPTRSGPGGAGCGPTASPARRSATGRWSSGSPPATSSTTMAAAWRAWAAAPDGWFAVLHGEVLATPVADTVGRVAWEHLLRRRRRRHHRRSPSTDPTGATPCRSTSCASCRPRSSRPPGGWW